MKKCSKAKEKKRRDGAWKRWKRNQNLRNKEKFKVVRNEYVIVRKVEERKFEKGHCEKMQGTTKTVPYIHKWKNKIKGDH